MENRFPYKHRARGGPPSAGNATTQQGEDIEFDGDSDDDTSEDKDVDNAANSVKIDAQQFDISTPVAVRLVNSRVLIDECSPGNGMEHDDPSGAYSPTSPAEAEPLMDTHQWCGEGSDRYAIQILMKCTHLLNRVSPGLPRVLGQRHVRMGRRGWSTDDTS